MTNRLKIYCVVAALSMSFLFFQAVSANTLNQRNNFFVNSKFDISEREKLDATLRHVSSRAYFYIEDSYWNRLDAYQQNTLLSNIAVLANEFDKNIYPKEVGLWGSEPNPGIDGDPKVTILLEELLEGYGGYFDTANGYSRQQNQDSNQREMIIVSSAIVMSSLNFAKSFLAHEFQHLISLNQKELLRNITDDIWLNESRSEYSISAAGYNSIYAGSSLEKRVEEFSGNPSDSLTEWPNKPLDYGIVSLFAEYLVEQYGAGILADTLKSSANGIFSINSYLAAKGYYETFDQIFMNWMGAVYLNDISQDNRLGYRNVNLRLFRISPQQRVFISRGLSEYLSVQNIKDWQPVWLEYDLSSFSSEMGVSFKIDLFGERTERFAVGYLAFYDLPSGEAGSAQIGRIDFAEGGGTAYILNSDKKLRKVTILATKSTKNSNFSAAEPARPLSIQISTIPTDQAVSRTIKEGSLIKRPREKEVYVVWGKYKRYLVPGVIALYGHLDPSKAIEVKPEIFDSYQTSNYVKYANDEKVYAIWPDGTRHWLNITPRQWDESYRDWNAIFTINDLELNYYKSGPDITR